MCVPVCVCLCMYVCLNSEFQPTGLAPRLYCITAVMCATVSGVTPLARFRCAMCFGFSVRSRGHEKMTPCVLRVLIGTPAHYPKNT